MNSTSAEKARTLVVPYVGTWIEILYNRSTPRMGWVVPYVGTWIEICCARYNHTYQQGRSLRGNVDRNNYADTVSACTTVVPYVGTWIEIRSKLNHLNM